MSKRRRKLANDIDEFIRRYGRTSRRAGHDPNDRKYDHGVERLVKRLPPDELDRLMRGEIDDDEETEGEPDPSSD